jgi:YlmC/YmxH family sporulation protein
MRCTVTALRSKEVVNLDIGCRLGCVTHVEIDPCTGCLVSITVFCGKGRCGFFGRGEEIIICWKDIVVIGEDTILVRKGGAKL